MEYKEQLKGKKLEIKSAKIMSPDGEWMDLNIDYGNDTIAPLYTLNPAPTISILDTVQNTVKQELRKAFRKEMNRQLWKMGGER